MDESPHEPSSLPWFRGQLQKKMAALEQEIAAHRHTLELLRQTENAYGRFVPHQILKLLGTDSILDLELGEQTERNMTIMFSDIRDFTLLCEGLTPRETFAFINSYLGEMEPVIAASGGFVDKYIGDAIMAVFPTGADDGLRAALGMLEKLGHYNRGRARAGYRRIDIGIGLNTGIVMLGTVGGTQRMEGTVLSDAVNLASRIEEASKAFHSPLMISEHTLNALADPQRFKVRFLDRMRIRGKRIAQSLYEVFDHESTDIIAGKEATRAAFEEAVAYYHLKAIDRAIPLLEACLREVPEDRPARAYLGRCRQFQATGLHEASGEVSAQLEWSTDFMVGVGEIDDQHREWVTRMNSLAAKVASGDGSGVDDVIRYLADYTNYHFANEEAIMRNSAYPFINDHLREHQGFVRQLGTLEAEIASGRHDPLYLAFRMQLFLFDWFANHTTKTDRHLGKFIRARKNAAAN